MSSAKLVKKLKSIVTVTGCSSLIFGGFLYYRNDERFFDNFLMPLTRKLFEAGMYVTVDTNVASCLNNKKILRKG